MKKTGLAGWSTSRTVTYRCRLGIKAESAGKVVITNDVPMPDRSPAVEHSRTFNGISEHGDQITNILKEKTEGLEKRKYYLKDS